MNIHTYSSSNVMLRAGEHGAAIDDLQQRLIRLGFAIENHECSQIAKPDGANATASIASHTATFGPSTVEAVRGFQAKRNLRVDGVCGPQTWGSLVAASWTFGQRFLYLQQPHLRGDDVAELQRRINALGFSTGRIDGIYGRQTGTALAEFQRNVGLIVDHVCGTSTFAALRNLGSRDGWQEPVALVHERELLRTRPGALAGMRIAIGEPGGLETVAMLTARALRSAGATPILARNTDGIQLARLANLAGVDAYIGLGLLDVDDHQNMPDTDNANPPDTGVALAGVRTSYFSSHGYCSPAGEQLAARVLAAIVAQTPLKDLGSLGLATAELIATRMPAVLVDICPISSYVEHAGAISGAIASGLTAWSSGTD